MVLAERQVIKKANKNWKAIDEKAFVAKNLYNQAIYHLKNYYEETGKHKRYFELDKWFRDNSRENYDILPNNTAQLVLKNIDQNYRSFFKLMIAWKKNKNLLNGLPKPPKYKHKTKGRATLEFTKNQFRLKDGFLYFPKKMNMEPIKTKIEKPLKIRIVPQSSCYVLEIIYETKNKELKNEDIKNWVSIDFGINNLCSVVSNDPGVEPLIVNGKPVKSINKNYNKIKAKIQSHLMKNHRKNTSKKLESLTAKRSRRIVDYMHCTSKKIIQHCIDNNIDTIFIGYNKNWKTNINIGKRNNQTFTQIPFLTLKRQIEYKAEKEGIKVIEHEESYTSKVDHLALEPLAKQENYLGKRKKRGLFQSSTGKLLNADINGAIGIARKVVGDDFISLLNIGCIAQPLKVQPL